MCLVVFIVIGAFAAALWMHGHLLYAAAAGAAALAILGFFIRKLILLFAEKRKGG